MKTYNFKGTEIEEQFYELAELLNDILGEEDYRDVDFLMPKEIIMETAFDLQSAFYRGEFERDENGMFYYSGMTEDFGGLLEKEYEKHMTKEQKIEYGFETEEY